MISVYQSAFAEALGWSLVDSLWQMGAIWFFYIIITRNGNAYSAQKRHSFALLGSAAGTVIFIISLALNLYNAENNKGFLSLSYFIGKNASELITGYDFAGNLIPLISIIYIPAVAFFSLRLIVQLNVNKNAYRRNLTVADDAITSFVTKMCTTFGINKKVSLWISVKAESPLTLGFWKPLIIMPVAVFSQLSCRQVEAVIAHELFHIKRNDYLINIFLTLTEVILFFNPFARLMIGNVKKERENRCDDEVLSYGFDSWEYSQALYLLGKSRFEKNRLAIAATGSGKEYLLHRIRRIMKRDNPSPSVLKPFIAFFLCLFVAGFLARDKQIPVLADAVAPAVSPVVYYTVEKVITEKEPEKKVTIPKKTAVKEVEVIAPPEAPLPPEPEPSELIYSEDLQEHFSYVADPETIEFTILDPLEAVVPEVVCETPQPYVQKSSFYFIEVDTTAGKSVIDL